VGPSAGLDGRKIPNPPGFFFNLYICYNVIVIYVSSFLFFCFVFILSLSLQCSSSTVMGRSSSSFASLRI